MKNQPNPGPISGVSGIPTQNYATPTPKQPNFFERMLPTAGGILGGLVTAPLEALDAVSGVGGTALNIAGAGVGSALGKALENKWTGQAGGNGVLASGIEGGLGQAGGALLGGALKSGAGMLGNVADKTATNLVQGQFAKGTLDSATAQTLRDMGVTDASQVDKLAPLSTGLNGAIKSGVQRGLTESDMPADLSKLGNAARNLIAENQMQLASANGPHDISNVVEKALLQAGGPGSATQVAATKAGANPINVFSPGALKNVLPENAFKVSQNFDALAAKAYKGAYDKMGNVNPDQLAKYKIMSGLADEAEKAAFGGDTVLPLSEANKAQIIQDLAPMKDVNPQAYNWHVNQVLNAKNVQDLRGVQAPLVRASKALGITQRASDAGAGTTTANVVRNIAPVAGGMVAGPVGALASVAPALLRSGTANKIGASTLERIANVLKNPAMGKLLGGGAIGTGQVVANSPNDIASAQGVPAMQTPGMGMAMPGGMPQPAANPYATGGISPASMSPEVMALQTGLIGLQDPYMAGSYAPLVNNTMGDLQKAGAANAALQALERSYQQAGGGQGLLGGVLNRLGQTFTGGEGTLLGGGYNAQAQQLDKTLQALGVPAVAPSLLQNQGAAQQNFSMLQQVINALGGGGSAMAGLPA